MKVTIKLFATLRDYNDNEFKLDIKSNTNIISIIESLNIPKEEIAIIMVNGRSADLDYRLKDKDILALFPPVGGG
ncbi:MAG: MoaD/ThiS family protein [Clostridiales bacterium]